MTHSWNTLQREFKNTNEPPVSWKAQEFKLFFEVESLLYLYERLVPVANARFAKQTWALISGYYVPESLANNPQAKKEILIARERIRYVKAATSWKYWLEWYQEQPAVLRLYQFTNDDHFEQRDGVLIRQTRLESYEQFFSQTISPAPKPEYQVATNGVYHFELDRMQHRVDIPDAFTEYAETNTSPQLIEPRYTKTPIEIDLEALKKSAAELDAKESALNFETPHQWQRRLHSLAFITEGIEDEVQEVRRIRIDGFFHLVGALGVGKSTLIWLLIYHVAQVEKKHVSIIVNTVVEAFQLARWLRLMDVKATPALGNNRADHARKLGFAHREIFNAHNIFYRPRENEPFFRWMPTPCTLSAIANVSIPAGEEPCWHLFDHTGKRHRCPLISVCPVHQISRDLGESQVWVFNPASFLYSRAPEGIGEHAMHFSEAVYHLSDLLIVDEADRVQANWDQAFAPTSVVLGTDDALIDWLHRQLGNITSGANRTNATRNIINRLTNMDDQSNMLANRAYRLLNYGRKRNLTKWIEHRQLTNVSIFAYLHTQLKKNFPKNMQVDDQETRLKKLQKDFKSYWQKPLHRESGFLAEWLHEFLGGDKLEKQLRKDLDAWLMTQMGWKRLKPEYRLLCRKLELAITLTALIKRIHDITHQLPWAENELKDEVPKGTAVIPERLRSALPESPLGTVLGLRAISSPKTDHRSFHAMRYWGVGRWLLINFHHLFEDKTGQVGPNVLLTSATSWLPGSATFHIAKLPQGILITKDERRVPSIELSLHRINIDGTALRVSGTSRKESHLRTIVHNLATSKTNGPTDLERELEYWNKRGEKRRILLVVNSYEQANWVADELQHLPLWRERVLRLFPDDADLSLSGIRTREVESFYEHNADI